MKTTKVQPPVNPTNKKNIRRKPAKSLRSILTLWFLLFSILPLAFVSGYSTVLYERSIDNELQKRLEGNVREVSVNLNELESYLENYGKIHASDPSLVYHLSMKNIPGARRTVVEWLKTYLASRIVLFDREGKLVVAQGKSAANDIQSQPNLESGDVYLADSLLKTINEKGQAKIREVRPSRSLEIVVYTRVVQKNNQTGGYIEEVLELNAGFVNSLKKRLNLEALIFDEKGNPVTSSRDDFLLYPKEFFPSKIEINPNAFFDLTSRGEPFGLMVRKILDAQGQTVMILGLAASKLDSQKVLKKINATLFSMSILVFLVLIPTLLYVSNGVVRPIHQLVEATEKMENGQVDLQLRQSSDTEVGLLIDSFNRMARSINTTQKELEQRLEELRSANEEIRNTQTHLVHAAKMASLGQLVAGVAHELNNPIGFIYSNMVHLKDYVEKLKRILEVAEKNPAGLDKMKVELELDYIIQDLPRIVESCQDGARRTRDIVLGLRNFSRLDEAQLKRVDVHEGIDNTITLLAGELKNRIKLHKDFGSLPEVKCFASQLNQVFMNIITNAAQAIDGQGDIWIKTYREGEWAIISIRDSGKGIPEDVIDKIFDPFFTTKPVGQGTGLGLSLSYGIIERHGGHINVLTKVGEGTEFVIRIPVDGPPDSAQLNLKVKPA